MLLNPPNDLGGLIGYQHRSGQRRFRWLPTDKFWGFWETLLGNWV